MKRGLTTKTAHPIDTEFTEFNYKGKEGDEMLCLCKKIIISRIAGSSSDRSTISTNGGNPQVVTGLPVNPELIY